MISNHGAIYTVLGKLFINLLGCPDNCETLSPSTHKDTATERTISTIPCFNIVLLNECNLDILVICVYKYSLLS